MAPLRGAHFARSNSLMHCRFCGYRKDAPESECALCRGRGLKARQEHAATDETAPLPTPAPSFWERPVSALGACLSLGGVGVALYYAYCFDTSAPIPTEVLLSSLRVHHPELLRVQRDGLFLGMETTVLGAMLMGGGRLARLFRWRV